MNDPTQSAVRPAWQYVLSLSDRLTAETTVAAQCELIVETVAQMIEGQADLWLSETFWRLPISNVAEAFPPEPPSDLMRRALDTRQVHSSTKDEPSATPAVAIPLLVYDKVAGVLEAKRANGSPFSDQEVRLLGFLATQSAIVLQSTHQTAIEHWRGKQLSLVSKVSAQIANVLDVQELARRVTDLILHTFRYYFVALFTLEPKHEILHCQASAGPIRPRSSQASQDEHPPPSEVQLGQGIIGHAAQAGTEIMANDVSQEPRYRHIDSLPETRAEVALPLKIEGRVLGVLDVQSDRPSDFHEIDLLILRALAENIAIAMEHARLYSDLRRRAEQISVIAEVGRAVASFLDLDELFDEVVTLIERQFGYPFVHLFTVDLARQQAVYRAGSCFYDPDLKKDELSFGLDDRSDVIPWTFSHGEMVLANDISRDPRHPPSALRLSNVRAELTVPFTFNDEVLGVLDVQSDQQNAFDADDCFLFRALADSVAIAIRNVNLYRSERWRRQVADSMREVAGLLSSDMVLEELLNAILFELERALPCDLAAICLLDGDELYVAAVRGADIEACTIGFSSDASLWLAEALSADQPTIRPPESLPDPLAISQEFPPDYSSVAAPLRAGDQELGLSILAHRTPGRYGAESQVIMAAFASYAAVAIENARIYQASQEQALISTVMLQVAEATQSLTTPDEVLETVARLAPMLVGINRCAILLWDESGAVFTPAAAYGLSPEQQSTFDQWRVTLDELLPFDELLNSAPLIVHDVTTDDRLSGTVVSALGFESLLALPLLAQGQVLGAMLVDYRGDEYEFDSAETIHDKRLAIIQGIAHQTAGVIENARLREAQQEEAYVSAALLQVAQTVANLSDLDDILSAIIRITPILVGVERCILFLWDAERSVFRPSHFYGIPRDTKAVLLGQQYALGDFGLLDAVWERDSLIKHSFETRSDILGSADNLLPPGFVALVGRSLEYQDPCSLLAFPLSVKGKVLGVMMLEEAATSSGSREKRIEIITGITQQAALALQNDLLEQERVERERLERELQLAYEIQQTFIPSQLPDLPGWELAATWRAARQVAGDFYDLIELPDGQLGLLVADVADKGMAAALFMVLTRTLLRAAVREKTSPSAVLAQVNDLLTPDAKRGMFVTAFYAVLSLKDSRLAYANAGHNPPLLLRSCTHKVERLSTGGMALGVLEGVQFEENAVSLEPGDCLVLYTDGVTEAFSPESHMYGEKRLQEVVQSANGNSAQAVLDIIDRSVLSHIDVASPSDDLTILVLRREGDSLVH